MIAVLFPHAYLFYDTARYTLIHYLSTLFLQLLLLQYAQDQTFMLQETKTKYLCRLDDDHILSPTYLESLLQIINSDESIGAVGGTVLHPEVPGYVFTEEEFYNILEQSKEHGFLNTILQLKRLPGTSPLMVPDLYSTFIMNKQAVEEVGGIATCYTACSYREETDLTLRLSLKGYKLLISPHSIIWHIRADSGGERTNQTQWEALRMQNERIFQERLKSWCDDPVKHFKYLWDNALKRV